jgi:hypothetical protein
VDSKLQRIKELITQKEAIDTELESLIVGAPAKEQKPRACSKCGLEGHSARKCPQKAPPTRRSEVMFMLTRRFHCQKCDKRWSEGINPWNSYGSWCPRPKCRKFCEPLRKPVPNWHWTGTYRKQSTRW